MIHLINMHQFALHALHLAFTLPVCKNQRIQRHKSLSKIASRGKSSMGWFYGYKLHVVMNQLGEIVCSALSNGYVADIKMVEHLVEGLEAKLYADRGFVQLQESDEYHLKQRNKIETLFSLLKGQYNLITSKARIFRAF